MIVSIVAAYGEGGEIGLDGKLLWHLPRDLRHFKRLTSHHPIVMGRKTFESIGRALPNRENIVLTKSPVNLGEGIINLTSVDECLDYLKAKETSEVFIIGGGEIYKAFLPFTDKLYITEVNYSGEADTYFPVVLEKDFQVVAEESWPRDEQNPLDMTFRVYQRS